MALFVDGQVSDIQDLTRQDSQLLDVAQVENIDVTQKLLLAQDEVAVELNTLLSRLSSTEHPFWYGGPPRIDIVVVTPPLQMWHTFVTLEMVYADAYNSQLNDRYAGKRDYFHVRARWAYGKLVETGLGVVSDPIRRASMPNVTATSGALPNGTYYVTMAWINRAGEEGASAEPAVIAVTTSTLSVQHSKQPLNAVGWNVYAGGGPDSMVQQNRLPIAVGTNWIQPNQLLVAGTMAGSGQSPNYLRPAPRVIQRG